MSTNFRFKVWHYSGALLFETMWPTGQELNEVLWQQYPVGHYKEKPITNLKMEGIKPSQPQASTQAYRPPNERGIEITSTKPIGGSVGGDRKPNKKKGPKQMTDNSGDNGASASRSKARASKFNFKGKAENGDTTADGNDESATTIVEPPAAANLSPEAIEKLKRAKNVNKKLREISKLKSRKDNGEHLELNQMNKIKMEAELKKELEGLKVS